MDLHSSFGGLRNKETYGISKRVGYSADDARNYDQGWVEVASATLVVRPEKQMISSVSPKGTLSMRYAVSVDSIFEPLNFPLFLCFSSSNVVWIFCVCAFSFGFSFPEFA